MPFSVRILRFFGILLLGVCALGVARHNLGLSD